MARAEQSKRSTHRAKGSDHGRSSPPLQTSLPVLGDIDISMADIRRLAQVEGPCVSLFLPTQSSGAETMQGPIRLGNLVEAADREMGAAGVSKRERWNMLDPIRRLKEDFDFWQHQSLGLAIFSAPSEIVILRVRAPLEEEATVSRHFRIRPLLPFISGQSTFFLLALTENDVRLFEATAHGMTELELGPIPASQSDALWFEDPESQLQTHRSGGEAPGGFHGHGLGEELRKESLERYFRLVDKGLHERIGHTRRPLMLACVAYYEPIFRSVSDYPVIIDEIIEGSPENVSAEALYARAWPLMERTDARDIEGIVGRYNELAGTGMTASGIEEVLGLATEGRVETLLVAEDAPEQWGSRNETSGAVEMSEQRRTLDTDLVDLAVIESIQHGGSIQIIPRDTAGQIEVAAILRY